MKNSLTAKVLKVIGVFSGAEAFGIICSVVKMKLVAMWLSATGVGLFGLFGTTVDTVSIITGLGLRQSGVREVAKCRHSEGALRRIAARLRGWCMLSGLVGALVLSFMAPWLSLWLFGDYGYWWQFMILGGALLLNSLSGGEQAILQGTGGFRRLAKAAASGTAAGLAISIPMFRWLGDMSVALSFLVYSLSILFFLFVYRDRSIPWRVAGRKELGEGAGFVRLGGYIALATFATNLAHMVFMSWLNRETSTAEVGYFQAGNTLVFRYTSLIFGAVGLEFYPRMAANSHSPRRMYLFVSHEISLLLKIFTPMLLLFLLFRRWIVEILYTADFEVILPFVTIAIFTIILRSVSTCMAFSIIAKGEGKTYLLTEGIDAVIGVCLNIWFYTRYGLAGIGFAQVIWYGVYTIMTGVIYFGRYRLRLGKEAVIAVAVSFTTGVAAVAAAWRGWLIL